MFTATVLMLSRPCTQIFAGEETAAGESSLVYGLTAPFQKVTLATIPPGLIFKVNVMEGEKVRKGQVIVELDNRIQKAQTEISRIQAELTQEIDQAKVQAEIAAQEWERLMKLQSKDAVSSKELFDAEQVRKVTALEHEKAKLHYLQAQQAYEREKLHLEELTLTAPFDGYITQILKRPGESLDEREGVVTMVQLDPLEVTMDCPLHLAKTVKLGDRVDIKPLDPHWSLREGKVWMVSRVADPGSQTFRMKLVVDNHGGEWIAGLKVSVNFASVKSVKVEKSKP